MKITDILIFLVFIVVVIWHSSQVWSDPKGFIARMKRIRDGLCKYSFGLLAPKWFNELLDSHTETEIAFARVSFIIIYILIVYIAIVSFI